MEVIGLLSINVSNQHVVCLGLTPCSMSAESQWSWEKVRKGGRLKIFTALSCSPCFFLFGARTHYIFRVFNPFSLDDGLRDDLLISLCIKGFESPLTITCFTSNILCGKLKGMRTCEVLFWVTLWVIVLYDDRICFVLIENPLGS